MSNKDPATTIDPAMTSGQRGGTANGGADALCTVASPSSLSLTHSYCTAVLCCLCLYPSALAVYSVLFMRWALAVTPANYPLFMCHVANEAVQLAQLGRYLNAT